MYVPVAYPKDRKAPKLIGLVNFRWEDPLMAGNITDFRWRIVQRDLTSDDDTYAIYPYRTLRQVLRHILKLKWYVAFGIEYKPPTDKLVRFMKKKKER